MPIDAKAIAAQLRDCNSVEEAAALLKTRKLVVAGLKQVAVALEITPRGTKPEIERQILTQAVGARLRYEGLRQG
jgi:hypothetical protein